MKTCETCTHKTTRKIFTGPSRRYDYDFQNVCDLGLRKFSGYATVIYKNNEWLKACEYHIMEEK